MDIESDALECECKRHRNVLRFYHGYRKTPWNNRGEFSPTFFSAEKFWNLTSRIIFGAFWFLLLEAGVTWVSFFAPAHAGGPVWFEYIVFVFFSVIAALFAFVATYLSMECIDTACHVLIGQTWYLFLDQEGKLHVHRENPVHLWVPTAFSKYKTWEDFLFHHRIFQVRVGGIFRRCKVIAHGGTPWKLSVGLFDRHIVVSDPTGSSIALRDVSYHDQRKNIFDMERSKRALLFVAQHTRVNDAIWFLEDQKVPDAAFNTLGKKCVELIRLMEASRQTMGRSKHAQLLRERLEAIFQEMPEDRVKSWTQAAEKAN